MKSTGSVDARTLTVPRLLLSRRSALDADPHAVRVGGHDAARVAARHGPRSRRATGDAAHEAGLRLDDQELVALHEERMRVVQTVDDGLTGVDPHDAAVAAMQVRGTVRRPEHRHVQVALPLGNRIEVVSIPAPALGIGAVDLVARDYGGSRVVEAVTKERVVVRGHDVDGVLVAPVKDRVQVARARSGQHHRRAEVASVADDATGLARDEQIVADLRDARGTALERRRNR